MEQEMYNKLTGIQESFDRLEREMADPAVLADQERFRGLAREHARQRPLIDEFGRYRSLAAELEEARSLAEAESDDPEFADFARQECARLQRELDESQRRLRELLIPPDPLDESSCILEIRAGTGGEEAALFAGDLWRLYTRYSERRGYGTEVLTLSETELGGVKEVIMAVEGRGAFSRLRYESGVHRVQRVPVTESSGRIHTSTATVAVLPEVEDVEVEVDPDDLEIDTFCASGPGGQHVNKTESAVRIIHRPTGLVVTCQDEKSQHKNRNKAMRVLKARLYDLKRAEQEQELAAMRRSQVGSGDRSERIRTYNFPQGRVSDHRIGLTLHRLEAVMDGDLDELIDGLKEFEQEQALAGNGSSA